MKDDIKERLDGRFAKWLRMNMADRGMTNIELAERIGIHQLTISQWRRGIQKPKSYPTLKALSEALDVKLDTVLKYVNE